MASLRYTQIRSHPGGTINYIANKDKMISGKVHDVYNVLNYMGEPESAERVYSFGHHCSANPVLAEKQIALHRARYFSQKNGGLQGATEGSEELLGLHFFLSYTVEDDPSEETMNEILTAVAMHPKLKDFAVFGANHFDKKHKHTHFFVSQYAAEGKSRKLCLHKKEYDDIRRYVNRLCVERGLSIIDREILRRDQEYSDWLDDVIAEGRVVVHPEREETKEYTQQTVPTKNLYYKWLKEQEEEELENVKLLTDKQLEYKKYKDNYFYAINGRRFPRSNYPNTSYAIPLYNEQGRRRNLFELIVILTLVVLNKEAEYAGIEGEDLLPEPDPVMLARTPRKLQCMLSALQTARELQIEIPADVDPRLNDIGKQMNALKIEKAKHEKRASKTLYDAITAYEHFRSAVEGVENPPADALEIYNTAYSIMASHQCTAPAQIDEFLTRYKFSRKKCDDYSKRLDELKKQYRDLKYLSAINDNPTQWIDRAYERSKKTLPIEQQMKNAERKGKGKTTPDDIIKREVID